MRTYQLYFFACLRLSDINVKPIKKEEHHHYSCAKVVFLFQKNVQQSEKKLSLHQIWQKYTPKRLLLILNSSFASTEVKGVKGVKEVKGVKTTVFLT